ELTTENATAAGNTTNTRPLQQQKTTTSINYVSTVVQIVVPVTIAGVTLLLGFGLITYALITGDNRIFFLTRTN
ncbi:unnamed protein product, partial [Rotaria sp. Silwood2]